MRHALRRGMKNPGTRAVGVSMVAWGWRVTHAIVPANTSHQAPNAPACPPTAHPSRLLPRPRC